MCNLYVLDSRSYHTQSGSVFPVFPKSELSLFYIDYGRKGADDDDDDDEPKAKRRSRQFDA